jgi:hypothetical protein
MINTTGVMGYFQRVFAKGLLPRVPVVSAHPMIRFQPRESDPSHFCELLETTDKAKNTEAVVRSWGIPSGRIALIGDSGGDGPHFEWGTVRGAFLIGSMAKTSLVNYCREKRIAINVRFGVSYASGEKRDRKREMDVDFLELCSFVEAFFDG